MQKFTIGFRVLLAATVLSTIAEGATLYDSGITALNGTEPTQLGRISRNGVISDWSSVKPFPGDINTSTLYRYTTYNIPIVTFPYVQATFDDVSGTASTFIAAYQNAYNPLRKSTTYLGDPGRSGNYFGVDPLTFQVIVNVGNTLVLAVNDTSPTGAGVGQPYRLLVEGFSDTNFNETPIPEPAVWMLTGAGLTGVLLYGHRRKEADSCV